MTLVKETRIKVDDETTIIIGRSNIVIQKREIRTLGPASRDGKEIRCGVPASTYVIRKLRGS